MDLHYEVEPAKEWIDIRKYSCFNRKFTPPIITINSTICKLILQPLVNSERYRSEQFIYVANNSSLAVAGADIMQPRKKLDNN